jgi:hypothetical protein
MDPIIAHLTHNVAHNASHGSSTGVIIVIALGFGLIVWRLLRKGN